MLVFLFLTNPPPPFFRPLHGDPHEKFSSGVAKNGIVNKHENMTESGVKQHWVQGLMLLSLSFNNAVI